MDHQNQHNKLYLNEKSNNTQFHIIFVNDKKKLIWKDYFIVKNWVF